MVDSCDSGYTNSSDVLELFPDGSQPDLRFHNLSALCSYGVTPSVMTGALRQILLEHFSDYRNVLNKTLQDRIKQKPWTAADSTTGIYIESLHKWNPAASAFRPAVLIKEHEWNLERFGIGDRTLVDPLTGAMGYAVFWQGAHSIFALATEGAEALMLATEIAKVMLQFWPIIQEGLTLTKFLPLTLGSIATLKEATDNYVVPVDVGYVYQESWVLTPDAPRLKKIDFSANSTIALQY